MQTSGIMKYIEKTWTTIKLYSSAGHQAIKDSSPEYYKATVDFCTPYVKLAGDVYLIVRNVSVKVFNNALAYVEKTTPVVLDTVSSDENFLAFFTGLSRCFMTIFLHRSSTTFQES